MEAARYATNRQITRIRTGQRSRNGVYLRKGAQLCCEEKRRMPISTMGTRTMRAVLTQEEALPTSKTFDKAGDVFRLRAHYSLHSMGPWKAPVMLEDPRECPVTMCMCPHRPESATHAPVRDGAADEVPVRPLRPRGDHRLVHRRGGCARRRVRVHGLDGRRRGGRACAHAACQAEVQAKMQPGTITARMC